MTALRKFFVGLLMLLGAGILVIAMRSPESGSAADWAGALANFAAVATALWLASSDRRREESAERRRIQGAREALRDWLKGMTSLIDVTTRHLSVPGWPDQIIREEIKFSMDALNAEWMQINDSLLPKAERRTCNLLSPVGQRLSMTLARVLVMAEEPSTLDRRKIEADINVDLQRLQFHNERLPPLG